MEDRVNSLVEQVVDLIGAYARDGKVDEVAKLARVIAILKNLEESSASVREDLRTATDEVDGSAKLIDICRTYKRQTYSAKFDPIHQRVLFRGSWYTSSGAAMLITGTNVNGWRWWKYKDTNGHERVLDSLRAL